MTVFFGNGGKLVNGRVIKLDPRAVRVTFPGRDALQVEYADGRILQVPLAWSARLSKATPEQRANVRILDDGRILSWPDVDEDISAEALLMADELIEWPLDIAAPKEDEDAGG